MVSGLQQHERIEGGSKWLGLVVWLLLSFAAAVSGAVFEPGAWYAALEKPAYTPPSWLFPPVWTFLYIAIAVAAWMVWREGGFARRKLALSLYLAQLLLNAAWSAIFFGQHSIGFALVEIIVLWLLVVATTLAFYAVRPPAGLLMVPYLAWISYAVVLTWGIWRLNRAF